MLVDQIADGEIFRTQEAFYLDLSRLLVQVNVDLILVVETTVQQARLNVVLLEQEAGQLSQLVVLTDEEVALVGKSLLTLHLLLSQLDLLRSQLLLACAHSFWLHPCKLIEDKLALQLWPNLTIHPGYLVLLIAHLLHIQALQQLILNEDLGDT